MLIELHLTFPGQIFVHSLSDDQLEETAEQGGSYDDIYRGYAVATGDLNGDGTEGRVKWRNDLEMILLYNS